MIDYKYNEDKKEKDKWTKDVKPVLLAAAILTFTGVTSVIACENNLGYTNQVKCEQSIDGRDVICWLVEIPNQPVPGIDIPLEEK